jgi:hypothetical protein
MWVVSPCRWRVHQIVTRITSTDVNAYIRDITDEDFTAKDFRTWGGTGLATLIFEELGVGATDADVKRGRGHQRSFREARKSSRDLQEVLRASGDPRSLWRWILARRSEDLPRRASLGGLHPTRRR